MPHIPIWPILSQFMEKIKGRENSCHFCSVTRMPNIHIIYRLFGRWIVGIMPPTCHVATHPLSCCRKYCLIRPYRRNTTFPQTVMASQQFVISLPVCSLNLIKKSGCIELLYRLVYATSANITILAAWFVLYMNSVCSPNYVSVNGLCIRWGGKREIMETSCFTWTCSMKSLGHTWK